MGILSPVFPHDHVGKDEPIIENCQLYYSLYVYTKILNLN